MANVKSAKKRMVQNERRRVNNSKVKSSIRTSTKKLIKALYSKDVNQQNINELHKNFIKCIDTASRKRIVHSNTAARKKSNIAKRINAVLKK